ncbi:MAG TPA: DUF1631 domain-containing protein [Casimicrobiaceae bacterium]|nr:DUF1631 domain-containing protein [Casimicrobiaceae bacterium]
MNATHTAAEARSRRHLPKDMARILSECRDLAIHRLLVSFSAVLDKIADMLMDRAGKSDIREEQSLFLDARQMLKTERANLMAEFEKRLRRRIDEGIAGKEEVKADFAKLDATQLTLVETAMMDESVITGNIVRVLENLCHDELAPFNRAIGQLLGQPDLETPDNPLAPATIVDAFAEALKNVKTDYKIKFQILKEVNQAQLSDINIIYADLNRHLTELHVVPGSRSITRGGPQARGGAPGQARPAAPPQPPMAGNEVDIMQLFRRMAAQGGFPGAARTPNVAVPPIGGAPSMSHAGMAPPSFGAMPPAGDGFPSIEMPSSPAPAAMRTFAPLAPTPSGYIPGAPIIATPALHEGLTRLQAGDVGFDVEGAQVDFSGIPQGLHNVLRDLQESPLGAKANQLESMTIEMVAMLFDFIFDTKDLPDGIKALLARLQIPVLKAAMLDGAFFAKKTHPSRLLVNALAQAGLGWSTAMGTEDPLYRKIAEIVHRVLDEFSDNLALFDDLREDLEQFLAAEEKDAEANIASSAEEINQRDRLQIGGALARSEVERRIEAYALPNFLASFLRQRWTSNLERVYLQEGEDSDAWSAAVTTLEDLVWSVQPKKAPEDRRHLVAMLPSLLKRLSAGLQAQMWQPDERESFMTNLVEAHAAAVKPSFASVPSPTAAVAEAAKAQAEVAKASGDEVAAAKAEALAAAMAPAEPAPPEPEREILDDEYLEIARGLERGNWVELEDDAGQLSFAKLAWVSPLRGTYLFTNRQGQKALSMTAEELADRFRLDTARLVEAEPLIDRALSTVLSQINEKLEPEETVAA